MICKFCSDTCVACYLLNFPWQPECCYTTILLYTIIIIIIKQYNIYNILCIILYNNTVTL